MSNSNKAKKEKKSYSIKNGVVVRDNFCFYRSFYETIEEIPQPEERAMAYKLVCEYSLNGTAPDLGSLPFGVRMAMRAFDYILSESYSNWRNGVKGAPFGVLGGNPNLKANESRGDPPPARPPPPPARAGGGSPPC
ncbi:MAG: DUF6291 domain-containing protein [Bacteroidales bacterium]|nr:DUF6291 domain-containing protein [Bacteroidales bacterium]